MVKMGIEIVVLKRDKNMQAGSRQAKLGPPSDQTVKTGFARAVLKRDKYMEIGPCRAELLLPSNHRAPT
jgi:hypothetical protein